MEPSIYSGSLLIKSSGVLTRRWAERYAVLRRSTLEWFVKNIGGNLTPAGQASLIDSTLVDAPGKYPHAFELILADGRVLPVRADGSTAASLWVAAFRRTVTRLIVADASGVHDSAGAAGSSASLRPLSPANGARARVPPVLLAATQRAELLATPADAEHPMESSSPVLLAGWLGLQRGRSLILGRARFVRHFFVLRRSHLAAYDGDALSAMAGGGGPAAVAGVLLSGALVDTPAQGFGTAAGTFELYYAERDEVLVVQVRMRGWSSFAGNMRAWDKKEAICP